MAFIQQNDVVVFATASDGTVSQWDGKAPATGIMLRWFVRREFGFPDLGFDIYRLSVPQGGWQALFFPALIVENIKGKTNWTYNNALQLFCASGLKFNGIQPPGNYALAVNPDAEVTIKFVRPCVGTIIECGPGNNDMTARFFVDGTPLGVVFTEFNLTSDGAKTFVVVAPRPVDSIVIRGQGSISRITFRLYDDSHPWQRIAHRCLPLIDTDYRCAPRPTGTAADEAKSRLPAAVAADWLTRYDQPFQVLLPALRRMALGLPAEQLPLDPNWAKTKLGTDERTLIDLFSLDPHGARILGLACDDPIQLDGKTYSYKVIGRWQGGAVAIDVAGRDPVALLAPYGVDVTYIEGNGAKAMILTFAQSKNSFSMSLGVVDFTCSVEMVDAHGVSTGRDLDPGDANVEMPSISRLQLVWSAQDAPILYNLKWQDVTERYGTTVIAAREPGPPQAQSDSLTATTLANGSPSGIPSVALDWPVVQLDGAVLEGAPICYQIGRRILSSDPYASPPPAPGATDDRDLLYGRAPLYLSSQGLRAGPDGRMRHIDRDASLLSEGWWGWWVRGVDLFGRITRPSNWALAATVDARPPNSPLLFSAEWVQRDMPDTTVSTIGRSVAAKRWLDSSTAVAGLVVSWIYGPEQMIPSTDIDGFRVLVRRAIRSAGAPAHTPLQYDESSWPADVAQFGPMRTFARGQVQSLIGGISITFLDTEIISVEDFPGSPLKDEPANMARSICRTSLELDGAHNLFVGASLEINGKSYPIIANGDGPGLKLAIEHPPAEVVPTGSARIRLDQAPSLVELELDVPIRPTPNGISARSGVLIIRTRRGANYRLAVLRNNGPRFLCLRGGAVLSVRDLVTWYPVWFVGIDDANFGPLTDISTTVAHAQVAVQAVRKMATTAIASAPSAHATVTAVNLTCAIPPSAGQIDFDPAAQCVQLATRADWYGHSRFSLTWNSASDQSTRIYRALGDEIIRLDKRDHANGKPHEFGNANAWPPGVFGDAVRQSRVLSELNAIDRAASSADGAALDVAYAAMCIDTQMLLARQDYSAAAFVALNAAPIVGSNYEDQLDGRSRAHWFYRLTSRTPAGLESAPTEPTPPICCPDVVAPAAPVVHMALAEVGAVKLRWLASPDTDLSHYEIFAANKAGEIADLATNAPVAVYTPALPRGGETIEHVIVRHLAIGTFGLSL